jgi:pimeloyl-ACP methyl ester carboxylesterase
MLESAQALAPSFLGSFSTLKGIRMRIVSKPFDVTTRAARHFGIAASMALAGALFWLGGGSADAAEIAKPTVVLVHGAFAESASWNGVADRLAQRGFHVVAAANPLRGVQSDATYVASVLSSIEGPVVLVGHSYGGSVASAAALGNPRVKALVYVAAFAPDKGETAVELSNRFPGSTLAGALAPPVKLPEGGAELGIRQEAFRRQFAADVPAKEAARMAVTQRPITEAALGEASSEPAWKRVPSWFIFGTADKNIPAEAHRFMANRAKSNKTIAVQGASHVVMVSHPQAVAQLIIEAADGPAAKP